MSTPSAVGAHDVVILGGGYAGLMAALRLSRRTSRLRVALINRQDAFLERVRVQEAIIRPVASRIPSLGRFLVNTGIDFICGSITALEPQRRYIRIATAAGERELVFQEAIYALGSTIDVEAIPGIAEHAYRLDDGEDAHAVAALRAKLGDAAGQALRIVTIGGAETGIEVAGEIKSAYPNAEVTMVSRSRCGEFRGERVAEAVRTALTRLGVHMMDNEPIAEIRPTEIVTASGRTIACDLCIWSGGLRAPSLAAEAGLAIDPQGRIWVDPSLRSISHPHILAVGDAAHPVAPTGAPYRLSAYGALVSGAHAADVVAAQQRMHPLPPFSFSTVGQGVAIGRVGVGFWTYPDDRQSLFVIEGPIARHMRNLFVWMVMGVLKLERRFPRLVLLARKKAGVMASGKSRDRAAPNGATGPESVNLDQAFAELRPAMFALAYRITGNRADAEEIVQDAFIRLHDAAPREAVRSLKAYLATITARLSLNRLRDQRTRRETYIGEWLPEPLLTEAVSAVRADDVSYALMAVLERLTPQERVVFVLRSAFDLSFDEIVPVVGRDAAACRKLFSRARSHILEERPRFTVDRERHRSLLRSFSEAARSGDTAMLVSLLDENVVFHGDDGGKAVAPKRPVVGAVAVAKFIIAITRRQPSEMAVEEAEINGEPGNILRVGANALAAIMIDTDGERIRAIYAIANPEKLAALASPVSVASWKPSTSD